MAHATRIRIIFLLLAIISITLDDASGQSVTPTSAAFDAASVKRSTHAGERRSLAWTPAGLSYVNITLADALVEAYGIERYQIVGPGWLTRDRFVIVARTGAPTDTDTAMRMLQSLLSERFELEARWERRELPVYVLRVTPGGPKDLKPVDTRLGVVPAPGGMRFLGMTMTEFVDEFLSRLPSIDRAVVNGTALADRYEFTLRIFDSDPAPGELKPAVLAGGPELFIHALEQVGLTLAREKRTVDVLVIDRARKDPIEN